MSLSNIFIEWVATYLSSVVNSIDFGLELWHPGRVDDWHGLDAQLGAGQGELDLGQSHFHRDVTVVFKPLPYLVPVPPQSLQYHKRQVDYSGIKTVTHQSN